MKSDGIGNRLLDPNLWLRGGGGSGFSLEVWLG